MENQITPRKIELLINLAQGQARPIEMQNFRRNILGMGLLDDPQLESCFRHERKTLGESSSGILDLEMCEGLGESCLESLSMTKSSTFNPAEMTGRSTEAVDACKNTNTEKAMSYTNSVDGSSLCSWSTSVVNNMLDKYDKQSSDVNEIIRNSIASGYSFHSRRDLTADEASLVAREAPLPVALNNLDMNITRNMDNKNASEVSCISMGTYFHNRCNEFGTIFPRSESPKYDYSSGPNLLEGEITLPDSKSSQPVLDLTLDSVPVRQPRPTKSAIPIPSPKHTSENPPPTSITPQVPPFPTKVLHPMSISNFPNAIFANPRKQHIMQSLNEDSSQEDTSISISEIAKYLGDQSEIRPSIVINKLTHDKKHNKLAKINTNIMENKQGNQHNFIDHLKDKEAAAISLDKNNMNKENAPPNVPAVTISRLSQPQSDSGRFSLRSDRTASTKTKSPVSKSRTSSTCSTVQENLTPGFRSDRSPLQTNKSQGEHGFTKIPSPNAQYRELDKSVDWQEILQNKRSGLQDGLAKASLTENWVEITVEPVNGFVGVSTEAVVIVTSQTNSWLTSYLEFDKKIINEKDIIIDLPRFPILLSPKKPEKFIICLTPNISLKGSLHFYLKLKDASVDMDWEQTGFIDVDFKLPVIKTITFNRNNNEVVFPSIQENTIIKKTIVLTSDCPADLLLDLAILEGKSMFSLSNVQPIKTTELNSILTENHHVHEKESPMHKAHKVLMNKQSCRLTAGNAIRAVISFTAPKLCDLQIDQNLATLKGCLGVNIIETATLLTKINLTSTVGTVNLVINMKSQKLHLSSGSTIIQLSNVGTIVGTWGVKFKEPLTYFKISKDKVEIHPGTTCDLEVSYIGQEDEYNESTLIFKDVISEQETSLTLSGGKQIAKQFPIKTTMSEVCWIREGRKEISLKSVSSKKINIKCKIVGNGFILETPKASGTDLLLTFSPCECRNISIIFEPTSMLPHRAKLLILHENEKDTGKNVRLHACVTGNAPRWAGLVTYGDTALVRATVGQPVELSIFNRSNMAAFITARVHFNLPYRRVDSTSYISGGQTILKGRATSRMMLSVDWSLVERAVREAGSSACSTLATVTVLTGSEFTRRRILRIIKHSSDVSNLKYHIKQLIGQFDGEDPKMEESLQEFDESEKSLDVLVSSLQELTAQINLPQDFGDHTILLTDETVLEHHTLCD